MKPIRRWFQYSLRSFLVVLTALAVWLGIIIHRARQQQEAADALVKSGGLVGYDVNSGSKSTWDASSYPLFFHCFHTVVKVGLYDDPISDATCLQVARLPRLKMLLVMRPVSQRGLTLLATLKHVESLLLRQGDATNIDFSTLQSMENLQILDLSDTRLADSDLKSLAHLKRLFVLRASLKDVSNPSLNQFQRSLPGCLVNPRASQLGGSRLPPVDL